MAAPDVVSIALAFGGSLAVVSTVPYALTAIEYRQRDNGLAYLLFVVGLGIWNLMFVVQLLTPEPMIEVFFLGLSVVGSVLAGLGWFLFASTASSTPSGLDRRPIYATVAVLGGLDIVLAMTTPVHTIYWSVPATADAGGFATIVPHVGYWLHTLFLVGLFAAGTWLFARTWRARPPDRFPRAYTLAGLATVIAIVASNAFAPGGFGVASVVAMSLTTIGWVQASRGQPLAWLRGGR